MSDSFPIVKVFGRHLDLSKIIAISEPQFDRLCDPVLVIDVQLRDEPLRIWPPIEWEIDWEKSYRQQYETLIQEWVGWTHHSRK